VSIHGGISRHGLEHLASTDRGVTMMRNMLRRAIRAVRDGADPPHLGARNGEAISTFAHDRVVPGIPPAATREEDSRLLRKVARDVVSGMVRAGS
jgi:predicted HD phosphohydrolase